jgi:hypothetical protein
MSVVMIYFALLMNQKIGRDEEEIPEGVIGAIQERLWILKFPIYEL